MSILDPIESRSLSSGLAQRTIKNLSFIQNAHENGEDVHVVMQVVNSLLGLLVFPIEKESGFFSSFDSVTLGYPPDFGALRNRLGNFPPLPSLTILQFGNCGTLGQFFKRVRNAIAHRRLEFSSESHDLDKVAIHLSDAKPKQPVDWEITLNAQDLLQLCLYIANEVVNRNL